MPFFYMILAELKLLLWELACLGSRTLEKANPYCHEMKTHDTPFCNGVRCVCVRACLCV